MFSKSLFFLAFLGCTASVYAASSCSELASALNRDIQKPSFIEHPPAWLNMISIQKRLGKPTIETINDRKVYRWKCAEDDNTYLRFVTDQTGKILHISGIYDDDSGSGMFGAAFVAGASGNQIMTQKTVKLTPNTMQQINQPSQSVPEQQSVVSVQEASNNNQANACLSVYNQIDADIKQYQQNIPNENLPWMNISWLTKQLGNPVITSLTQTYNQWNQFSAFDDGLGNVSSVGKRPANLSPFEKDQMGVYIKLLGKPLQTKTQVVNQYQWQCGKSQLSFFFDKDKLISLNANICTDNTNCSIIQLPIRPSLAELPLMQQVNQQMQGVIKQAESTMLSSYNKHYQTQLTTQDQLNAAMTEKVQQFYSSVRSCQPGAYTYPKMLLVDIVFPVTEIAGMQNGKCALTTTFQVEKTQIKVQCLLSPQTLALYTNDQAQKDLFNPQMDALNNALQVECKHTAQDM